MVEDRLYKLDQEEYSDTHSSESNSFTKVGYIDIKNTTPSHKNTNWKEAKCTYSEDDDVIEDYWDEF